MKHVFKWICHRLLLYWWIGNTSHHADSLTVSSCSWQHYSKVSALSSIPFSWGQSGQVTNRQLDRLDRQIDSEQLRKHKHSRVLFWVHESLALGVWLDSSWKLRAQWVLRQLLTYYWPGNVRGYTHTNIHIRKVQTNTQTSTTPYPVFLFFL